MTKKIHDVLMMFLFIVCGIMLASFVICAEPTEVAAAERRFFRSSSRRDAAAE